MSMVQLAPEARVKPEARTVSPAPLYPGFAPPQVPVGAAGTV